MAYEQAGFLDVLSRDDGPFLVSIDELIALIDELSAETQEMLPHLLPPWM